MLIVVIRDHDLRRAGERGCRRRSRATVVYDVSNTREQCVYVDLAYR
jgi:hypothetical protein